MDCADMAQCPSCSLNLHGPFAAYCSRCGAQLAQRDSQVYFTNWLNSVELGVDSNRGHLNVRGSLISDRKGLSQAFAKQAILVRVCVERGWDNFLALNSWGGKEPEMSLTESAKKSVSSGTRIIEESRSGTRPPPVIAQAGTMGGAQVENIRSHTPVESLHLIWNDKSTSSPKSDENENTDKIEFFSTIIHHDRYTRIPFPPMWKRLLLSPSPKGKTGTVLCSVDIVHSSDEGYHLHLGPLGFNEDRLKVLVRTLPNMRLELPPWFSSIITSGKSPSFIPDSLIGFKVIWNGPVEIPNKKNGPGRRMENYPAEWQESDNMCDYLLASEIDELLEIYDNYPLRGITTGTVLDGAVNNKFLSGLLHREGNTLSACDLKPNDLDGAPQPIVSLWLDEYRYHIIELII